MFKVHKIILAARCPTFYTQFCGTDWADGGTKASEVKHDDFDPEAMKLFIQYVYTGQLKMDLKYVISVL